jgi:hypothetical protein
MVSVKITVKGTPETDTYARDFAKIIDLAEPYVYPWKEEWYMKNPDGTHFTSSTAFEHTETLDLAEGTHTIKVAPGSTSSSYTWQIEVLINDATLGVQSGRYTDKTYDATFTVTAPPPPPKTLAETISDLMNMMIPVMMLMIILPMLTGLMKSFKTRE